MQDNEVVLFIDVVKMFFVFIIFIHKSCIRELANKVIVHFAVFIFEFTNVQLEVRDFSFDIERLNPVFTLLNLTWIRR